MKARTLIGTEHGVTDLFVSEMLMEQGSAIPLHTHPTDEAFVVMEGTLTLQVGEETLTASAETFVRVPAGAAHAVINNQPQAARALAAAAWNRETWFTKGTTYLEGKPRKG
jgi:quercetin dioxygenase-like cupin family protein